MDELRDIVEAPPFAYSPSLLMWVAIISIVVLPIILVWVWPKIALSLTRRRSRSALRRSASQIEEVRRSGDEPRQQLTRASRYARISLAVEAGDSLPLTLAPSEFAPESSPKVPAEVAQTLGAIERARFSPSPAAEQVDNLLAALAESLRTLARKEAA